MWDAFYAASFFLKPSVGSEIESRYYARDRWPKWDYLGTPPSESAGYLTVGKNNDPEVAAQSSGYR